MVKIFNKHREDSFIPSEWTFVENSISRWNVLVSGWINIGLKTYIVIYRKPENVREIQNAACSESRVMFRLLLVKDEHDSDIRSQYNNEVLAHVNVILKYLTLPWVNSERGVCVDCYYSSVSSAEENILSGLIFIVVLKTATKKY